MVMPVTSDNERVDSRGLPERESFTYRCDKCGAEFDYFTYGGPCPGDRLQGCGGELRRRRVTKAEREP